MGEYFSKDSCMMRSIFDMLESDPWIGNLRSKAPSGRAAKERHRQMSFLIDTAKRTAVRCVL